MENDLATLTQNVAKEMGVLCPACANKWTADDVPQFEPTDADINYEDASLFCDECSERIESAYAEE
jgi:hypothetical protein